MVTVQEALIKAKSARSGFVVVSALEFPSYFGFFMTPKGKEYSWDDGWCLINKKTGKEIPGNPGSTPEVFVNAKPIEF